MMQSGWAMRLYVTSSAKPKSAPTNGTHIGSHYSSPLGPTRGRLEQPGAGHMTVSRRRGAHACRVGLQPDGPPEEAGEPVHHHKNVDGSYHNSAGAEAELLAQVGHLVNKPEGAALAAPPDPSQPQQPVPHH